jgi:RNA polymerase sigma-70 factor, ECF subfamily
MSEVRALIEKEIPRLRRYARALTRDRIRADDLVQSCLVRALAKEHLWQPGTNIRTWLFTILHNLHVSNIRHSLREQSRAGAIVASLRIVPPAPDARLEIIDLDRAIAKLPEWQRQVILLVGLEGMRYDQAAAIIGVPVGTIRSRIARARDTLRRLMDGEAETETSIHPRAMPNELAAAPLQG